MWQRLRRPAAETAGRHAAVPRPAAGADAAAAAARRHGEAKCRHATLRGSRPGQPLAPMSTPGTPHRGSTVGGRL